MNYFCLDDDIDFLNKLQEKLLSFSIQENIDMKVNISTSIPLEVPSDVDAYFLDIEFPDDNIFQFIEKIRLKDLMVPIIIISNYDHYVLDSVKYNIFDFIRKKYFQEEFKQTLNRLIIYQEKLLPTLLIKNEGIQSSIKVREIAYIETYSHNTILHTIDDYIDLKKDTKYILGDNQKFFVRVHRSYFVNPIYVQAISNDELFLKNNIKIPVGKKYQESVKRMIRQEFLKNF